MVPGGTGLFDPISGDHKRHNRGDRGVEAQNGRPAGRFRQVALVEAAARLDEAEVHVAAPVELDLYKRDAVLRDGLEPPYAAYGTQGSLDGAGDVFFHISGI